MDTKQAITNQVLQCTPKELERMLDIIHNWANTGDQLAQEVCTADGVIELLSRPEYVRAIKNFEYMTGENYFSAVLECAAKHKISNVELFKGHYGQGDTLTYTADGSDFMVTGEFYVDRGNMLHHTHEFADGTEIEILKTYQQ